MTPIKRNEDGYPIATLFVKDNRTGEIKQDFSRQWVFDDDYIWSEGNYACDCNRAIFFNRPRPHQCGQERYSVKLVDSNGDVLYSDFDDEKETP